ncbi:MAG TPA: NUDIX domain-containing protein [Streptosporangiaceae bacterium]|jgi:ADP-ribose pyrophosphatase YjhB (NUDIX family)
MSARGQVVTALAVIRRPRDGALLVSEHDEPEPFHRPLGGHVEFGEYALDAVHRELLEEIGQGLAQVRLLGVLENIFPWYGATQHEIVFLYEAAFSDPAAYDIEEQGIRDEASGRTRVMWRAAGAVSPPLYPAGVAGLIAAAGPA